MNANEGSTTDANNLVRIHDHQQHQQHHNHHQQTRLKASVLSNHPTIYGQPTTSHFHASYPAASNMANEYATANTNYMQISPAPYSTSSPLLYSAPHRQLSAQHQPAPYGPLVGQGGQILFMSPLVSAQGAQHQQHLQTVRPVAKTPAVRVGFKAQGQSHTDYRVPTGQSAVNGHSQSGLVDMHMPLMQISVPEPPLMPNMHPAWRQTSTAPPLLPTPPGLVAMMSSASRGRAQLGHQSNYPSTIASTSLPPMMMTRPPPLGQRANLNGVHGFSQTSSPMATDIEGQGRQQQTESINPTKLTILSRRNHTSRTGQGANQTSLASRRNSNPQSKTKNGTLVPAVANSKLAKSATNQQPGGAQRQYKTLEQREAEYALARLRIFGSSTDLAAAKRSSEMVIRQPRGPDGSVGFVALNGSPSVVDACIPCAGGEEAEK